MEVLLALALKEGVPLFVNWVKDKHAQVNPTLPPLTDAEAKALMQDAIKLSVAKDDAFIEKYDGKQG